MRTSNHTIELHDNEPTIASFTQYGVRFPDGEINWTMIDRGSDYKNIWISDLVPGGAYKSRYSKDNWAEMLKSRAEKAKLSLQKYTEMHEFIQRTVMVAVTAAEGAK